MPAVDILTRVKAILAQEADAIARVHVDHTFVHAVQLLHIPHFLGGGKIISTGMGKAGFAAGKFAATLRSVGIPAVFLHPGDAAHGDLGVVTPGDRLVVFSTSGQTREVLEVIQYSRPLGVTTVIGITSHPDGALRSHCDVVLDMGAIREPCPLGLTPSASTTVMLAMSDALALVLMEQRGCTREDFGHRHHGGYLGSVTR